MLELGTRRNRKAPTDNEGTVRPDSMAILEKKDVRKLLLVARLPDSAEYDARLWRDNDNSPARNVKTGAGQACDRRSTYLECRRICAGLSRRGITTRAFDAATSITLPRHLKRETS